MKNVTSAFLTMLQTSKTLVVANLYTFTLRDGTVIRWTDGAVSLTVGANTFVVGPVIKRDSIKLGLGVSVGTMQIKVSSGSNVLVNGAPVVQAIARGDFDEADVLIEKFLAPSWTDTTRGSVVIHGGEVADSGGDRLTATMQVASKTQRFSKQFPVNYLLPNCVHALFDHGCTLSRAAFVVSGTVSGTPGNSSFDTSLTQADDYFALGKIQFTSGALNGAWRSVQTYKSASGAVSVAYPFDAVPAAGDTFDIWPGCDKQEATCSAKFSNLANFRGFPYVPDPNTVYDGTGVQAPAPQTVGGGGSGRSGRGQAGIIKQR